MAIRCSQDKGEKSAIEIVSGVSGGEYRNSCHQMWYLRLGLLWCSTSSSSIGKPNFINCGGGREIICMAINQAFHLAALSKMEKR